MLSASVHVAYSLMILYDIVMMNELGCGSGGGSNKNNKAQDYCYDEEIIDADGMNPLLG